MVKQNVKYSPDRNNQLMSWKGMAALPTELRQLTINILE